jgi:hypothetical protein
MSFAGENSIEQISATGLRVRTYSRHSRSQTGERNREGWTMDVQQETIRPTTSLAKMSLEELLFYVLVGEGRIMKDPVQT